MSLARIYRNMDMSTGMFPRGWSCQRCGRELDADGGHPAELYAGTYTGLCYPCTSEAGYVVETHEDGCQVWSYPPHCPSWRRDRERAFGYLDCEQCKGSGYLRHGSWPRAAESCRDCLDRYCGRGRYDTRSPFSRELSRAEAEHLAYVEVMGCEPPPALDPEASPIAHAQWTYPTGAGRTRAEQKTRALELVQPQGQVPTRFPE